MYAAAAAELRLAVQTTPWVLTDNFVSATREGRGALALTGPGDPTARGQGFSFMKETAKVGDPASPCWWIEHQGQYKSTVRVFWGRELDLRSADAVRLAKVLVFSDNQFECREATVCCAITLEVHS